ncbi:hypothetical protein [Paenibacillus sp. YYML68]|uniref:hypothetical protein n=1 Tax=Paenibacillus sp. YYML68 TaxID=2909250 RepID=UPI0024919163|nr:hypothetical protein [Paenibacillus sp. YYML68]
MWKRLFSLRRWGYVVRRVLPLLGSRRVPLREKLLFALPVLVYWIMPDLWSFMPLDDAAVTLLMMNWFTERIEKKYGA